MQPHVGVAAGTATWIGARDYKRLMTWMPYTANILVLTRDRGSGRVTIGKDGLPRVAYWPNAFDRANMLKARTAAPVFMLVDIGPSPAGRLLAQHVRPRQHAQGAHCCAWVDVCRHRKASRASPTGPTRDRANMLKARGSA